MGDFGRSKRLKKKSGDSARQDEEAAQEKVRNNVGSMSPQELAASLPDQVQGAADRKKEEGAPPERVDATAKMVLDLTGLVAQLVARVGTLEGAKLVVPDKYHDMRCGVCGQAIWDAKLKRGVCNGDHVMVRVIPNDMDLWSQFQGYIYNSVRYAGMQLVPKSIEMNLRAGLSRWERHRKRMHMNPGRMLGHNLETGTSSLGQTPII